MRQRLRVVRGVIVFQNAHSHLAQTLGGYPFDHARSDLPSVRLAGTPAFASPPNALGAHVRCALDDMTHSLEKLLRDPPRSEIGPIVGFSVAGFKYRVIE